MRFWKRDVYLAGTVGSGIKLFCGQRVNKGEFIAGAGCGIQPCGSGTKKTVSLKRPSSCQQPNTCTDRLA